MIVGGFGRRIPAFPRLGSRRQTTELTVTCLTFCLGEALKSCHSAAKSCAVFAPERLINDTLCVCVCVLTNLVFAGTFWTKRLGIIGTKLSSQFLKHVFEG